MSSNWPFPSNNQHIFEIVAQNLFDKQHLLLHHVNNSWLNEKDNLLGKFRKIFLRLAVNIVGRDDEEMANTMNKILINCEWIFGQHKLGPLNLIS